MIIQGLAVLNCRFTGVESSSFAKILQNLMDVYFNPSATDAMPDCHEVEARPWWAGITMILAMMGFWWQLRTAFILIFPLNLLLLPFSFMETVLWFFVASS